MNDRLATSLDRHITGNYGASYERPWGRCPDCGTTQEDAEYLDNGAFSGTYQCPCGCVFTDDEAEGS
jgi:hypothetical protein